MKINRARRRRLVARQTGPGGPSPSQQRDRLRRILQRAVEVQPEADCIVRLCCAPGDVPFSVWHQAHTVTVEYAGLLNEIDALTITDPRLTGLRDQGRQCINHHLLLVDGAVNMALPPPPHQRRTDPTTAAQGLGGPGERLRRTLDQTRHAPA
jgi:hypothetical protein